MDSLPQNGKIKAIPTEYNGVKFRSRLEARWAVFFDKLGIKWLYEAEGYQTPYGNYVPDFWLPGVYLRHHPSPGVLFEVKSPMYKSDEHPALEFIAENLETSAMLAKGMELNTNDSHAYDWNEGLFQIAPWWDNGMYFHRCKCGRTKFEFSGGSYDNCNRESSNSKATCGNIS